jgi:hypothetical protein
MEFLAGNRIRGLNSERVSSYTTETVYNQTGGWAGALNMYSGATTRRGIRIEAGSPAIGKVVRKVKGELSATGAGASVTGNFHWSIRNNADTVVAVTPDVAASTLPEATTEDFTEYTFDVSRTLVEGDRIQVEYSGGGASNTVNISYNNGLPAMPSGTKQSAYNGSYTDTTTGTPYFIVDSTPASYTVNALPNIEDGSIFYETDTNKSYVLYNGSWSEV